jgi:hypothetical protein
MGRLARFVDHFFRAPKFLPKFVSHCSYPVSLLPRVVIETIGQAMFKLELICPARKGYGGYLIRSGGIKS